MSPQEIADSQRNYRAARADDLLVMGWRETVSMPELGIEKLHAKLDSGAMVSSLHASALANFKRNGQSWIRFRCWSDWIDEPSPILCEARCIRERAIRSSNGLVEIRPTIETLLYIGGFQWSIEVTLCDRSSLECKLLLGRNALADRCLIDCSRNHLFSRP